MKVRKNITFPVLCMIILLSGEDGYKVIFNKKYKLSETETIVNFKQAQKRCEEESGNLAFIENDLDYQAMKQILPIGNDVWLGAKTVHFAANETFVWLHNSEEIPLNYNFTLFHRNYEYDCVTFEKMPQADQANQNFRFDIWLNERPCTDTFQFLCQKACINDPGKLFEFRLSLVMIILFLNDCRSGVWRMVILVRLFVM